MITNRRNPGPDAVDPRAGRWVPQRHREMHCEYAGCRLPALRSPVVHVPPRPQLHEVDDLHLWSDVHYCERHVGDFTVEGVLRGAMLGVIEEMARRKWRDPALKPDFENARLEWLLVTTPEYRQWLARLELGRAANEAVL
jgi:hypothetical protein